MNKAITIISYCDTKEKKVLLKELISRVKEIYPDRVVLVYSHYSNVECEYYEQSDYYIYDHSNPSSPRAVYEWTYIPQLHTKFYRKGEDWGWAVIQMLKRSALFLDSIGVESSLYLNYDIDLGTDQSIKMLDVSEYLVDHTGIFTKWGDYEQFSLCYFWLDIKRIGREFFESINKDKYVSYDSSFIAERVFHEIMTEGLGLKCLKLNLNLNGKVSGVTRDIDKSSDLSRYFSTMVASRIEQLKFLAIWNSLVQIQSILLDLDGVQIELQNNLVDKTVFLEQLPEGDINIITVLAVNSELIEPYSIKCDQSYWNSNTHENV